LPPTLALRIMFPLTLTVPTAIPTLPLHDALPISATARCQHPQYRVMRRLLGSRAMAVGEIYQGRRRCGGSEALEHRREQGATAAFDANGLGIQWLSVSVDGIAVHGGIT